MNNIFIDSCSYDEKSGVGYGYPGDHMGDGDGSDGFEIYIEEIDGYGVDGNGCGFSHTISDGDGEGDGWFKTAYFWG